MIASVQKEATLFACPDVYLFVFYSAVENRKLEKTIQWKLLIIPIISEFVEHGHPQHAGLDDERASVCTI